MWFPTPTARKPSKLPLRGRNGAIGWADFEVRDVVVQVVGKT